MDPYSGGTPQQRPGTGTFAKKKKDEDERQRQQQAAPPIPTEFEVDPLLAEIDRMRALDTELTESGAHRALLAARAYHHGPPPVEAPPVTDAAAHVTTRVFARRGTPPEPTAGVPDAAD